MVKLTSNLVTKISFYMANKTTVQLTQTWESTHWSLPQEDSRNLGQVNQKKEIPDF